MGSSVSKEIVQQSKNYYHRRIDLKFKEDWVPNMESVTLVLGDAFLVIWVHVRCKQHEALDSREHAVFAQAWIINRNGHAQNKR